MMIRAMAAALLALTASLPAAAADPAQPRLTVEQLRAKYGDRHGYVATIGGVEVYYKDEGAGPALLMVHGSVSSLNTWDGIVARLKGRYRIIRYDVPPGGLSGSVSDAAAAAVRPTDIAEGLLAQLGVTHITFIGVSSGGTLGVFLAAKRPDLVDRLIIANTPADPVSTAHLRPSPAFEAAQKEAKATGFQSRQFWDLFHDYFSGDPKRISPGVREHYYDINRRGPEANPIALVAQVADHAKALDAMAHVTAPTLLIWGGADPLLPAPAMDTLAGYLTHAPVSKLLLPDVGHYPPLEVPDRFATLIAAYVEAVTPVTTPARTSRDR